MDTIHNKITLWIAAFLLVTALVLAFTAAWNDVAIVDEDPHIGAGISYLTQRDMRLNPEHPPLAKDLAALPLLFIPNLIVPTDDKSWTEDINGQWDFGREFLFRSGNDADLITRLSRIAPLLMMLGLGWLVFLWTRQIAGNIAGLLALTFYTFSPVVLSHGHFVTTDVPAALGAFGATYFLLRYFAKPTWKNLFLAGIAFGIAEALKFSLILLIPYFAILAFLITAVRIFKMLVQENNAQRKITGQAVRAFWRYIGGTFAIGVIGYVLVIYPLYTFHTIGYPLDRQLRDTAVILSSFPSQTLAHIAVAFVKIPLLKPFAQYLLGLFMVLQRVTGGNTTYFLGEVSAAGWKSYFPIVYLLKMPLGFHFLSLVAGFLGLGILFKDAKGCFGVGHTIKTRVMVILAWVEKNFTVLAMLLFLAIYWFVSMRGNLNIGVRHLLPTLPFVFALTAIGLRRWLQVPRVTAHTTWGTIIRTTHAVGTVSMRSLFIGVMLIWTMFTVIATWPSFLAYFNEIAGGPSGGHNFVVDSNLDWGQDLKRLATFVEKNGIHEINIDYFGWADPTYYIRTAKVNYWSQGKGVPIGWLAVSATYKQQACARPAPGFDQSTTGYCFLQQYPPATVIGNSIFVYNLP